MFERNDPFKKTLLLVEPPEIFFILTGTKTKAGARFDAQPDKFTEAVTAEATLKRKLQSPETGLCK